MQDKGRVDDVGGPDGNRRRGDVVADGGCSGLVRLVGETREGGRGIYGGWDVVAGEGEIVVADDARAHAGDGDMVEDWGRLVRTEYASTRRARGRG